MRVEYNEYVKKNRDLNTIPIKINELATRFDVMTRQKDMDTIQRINTLNSEITTILASIRADIENDKNSVMNFRMLSNMHAYHQVKVKEIIQEQEFDTESYVEVIYIKGLFSYMNRLSQSLMMSYLEYSSDEYANMMAEMKNKQTTINIVLIGLGLFSIAFVSILLRDIFRTLKELSITAKLLADGKWHIPDITAPDYRELSYVAGAFNKMKEYIIIYMNQLKNKAEVERQLQTQKMLTIEKEKLLKESQLLNLQMQMNPHFLFNTLNMIGRTAMLEENEATVKLIESISVMLRFNLESEGKLVPLKEELKALQGYLFIQEMRFQDRLTIQLNTSDSLDGYVIPPMSLQPVVENCLIHGLFDSKSDGKIEIDVQVNKDSAEIFIRDNGIGIPEEKLNQLFLPTNEKKTIEQKKTSIGLANVKKRLELSFGQESLLQVKSTLTEGTEVQIRLPKVIQRSEGIA